MMNSKTSINDRLHGLDHLRAFAIIFVFIFHYSILFYAPQSLVSIGKFGWTGVDLFFVLSGYLIASQLFKEVLAKGVNLRVFFTKRIFRIIPVYLFILLLYFLFPSFREREALAPLWKYLTFTQNIGLDIGSQGTFSHAWSLCIEEQFYLLFPLMLWVLVYFKRINKIFILLLILFLAGFIFRLYTWTNLVSPFIGTGSFGAHWYKWIYYLTLCRLDGLIVGVLIAAIFEFKPVYRIKVQPFGNYLLVISILILATAFYRCKNQESLSASIFGFPLISLGYGLMVLGALCPGSLLYNFRSGVTQKIADLSFAIYLCHKIVLHLSQSVYIPVEKDSWMMFVIGALATVTVAYVLNVLIEKQFLRVRNIVIKRMNLKN